MDISSKVVVVTGGGSGIGEAASRLFSDLGAKIAILDRNASAISRVSKETNAVGCVCDITQEQEIADAIAKIVDAYDAVHVCLNVAGTACARTYSDKDRNALNVSL